MTPTAIKLEVMVTAKAAADKYFKEVLGGEDRYACGFAWVTVKPKHKGNTKLGKAERVVFAQLGLRKDWTEKNYEMWNPGEYHGQNIDTKEAGARAAAEVLRRYGFDAYAGSRLD